MKKILIGVIVIVIITIIGYAALNPTGQATEPSKLDGFAKCLTEKGAVIYTLSTCPHCIEQKKAFGSSVRFLNDVDCVVNKAACQSAGVEAVPTWNINGETLRGTQTLQKLSEVSGCELFSN